MLAVGIESLGVPFPGETSLLVGVFLASQGRLSVVLVAVVAFVGAVGGDNIGFVIGRRFGPALLRARPVRRLYRPEHLEWAQRFFERRGWVAVFWGRFIAILRILAGPLAGMHGMPWRQFAVANAAGGAVWIAVIVTVGAIIGRNLDRAVGVIGQSGYIGLGVAVVAVVLWLLMRLRRARTAR